MSLWTAIATCEECGRELNRAEHVPEPEKGRVALSAPLVCICPEKHHNTLSDLNLRVRLEWVEESVGAGP